MTIGRTEFLKTAIKDYKVGAAVASSKHVIRKILKNFKPEHKYIVEYGPGDGVITKELLKLLPSDGRIVGIETNAQFVSELQKIDDPRFSVLHADVADISKDWTKTGLPRIDAVISGIPFSIISSAARAEIVKNTHRGLRDGGMFLVYQYSPLMMVYLKKIFKKLRLQFEPRNLLPYFIMVAEK